MCFMMERAEDCLDSPVLKRSRLTVAATNDTKYNPAWIPEFPFICEGKQDPVHNFFCKVCHKGISCSHQGIAEVRRHEKSKLHVNCVSAKTRNSCLSDMGFVPVGSAVDNQV